jgi:predicted metal-binding protein
MISKPQREHLVSTAKELGASAASVISSCEIRTEEDLAALCNGEYPCPNYGLAASCPPHVKGPEAFRKWQSQSEAAVVVKIELPSSILFSNERKGVMQLLHQITAGVEAEAVKMGFDRSRGFAGGSCKALFCEDQENCRVVTENKPCCHMTSARPSMSGFGIDVTRLMISAGWPSEKADPEKLPDKDTNTWVAGLILIA